MNKLYFLFIFFLVAICFNQTQAQLLTSPQNTYVVIVGVLEWQNGLSSFNNKHRKDAEFEKFFVDNEIPTSNIISLYDTKATLKNMVSALETISSKATSEATIVFYYAGHGVKPASDIYLANYDINTKETSKTGFSIKNISSILGKSKAPNIILLADCCYSGGLIEECQKLGAMGKKSLALTSATASNVSTGNWTFTQTLLDCFYGNPIGNHNNNGQIELSELRKELFQAMKYRERQLFGYENTGYDEKIAIAKVEAKNTIPEMYGSYLWAKKDKKWVPVRVVDETAKEVICEFYFYSDKEQKTLDKKAVRPIHFVQHAKGASVEVSWEGKWYAATVLKSQDGFCYIKYNDYDDSWNEWVLYDRIRTGKEKIAKVWDSNDYYPAVILEEKDKQFYIHYNNYDASWDEWVGEDRIKKN